MAETSTPDICSSCRCYGKGESPPPNATVFNVTSKGPNALMRKLSPYHLGPCSITPFTAHHPITSLTLENAWQYSKVYPEHADEDRKYNAHYTTWAREGWRNPEAVRFPMGRGKKPLYSLHCGQQLDYIAARYRIYVPLYAAAVRRYAPDAFGKLVKLARRSSPDYPLWLFDFDGYTHVSMGLTLEDVLYADDRMGHGFVLLMMLEAELYGTAPLWEKPFDARRAARSYAKTESDG